MRAYALCGKVQENILNNSKTLILFSNPDCRIFGVDIGRWKV